MIYWTVCKTDPDRLEEAAPGFLSPQEQARLDGMRFPKRRREWLLGRWTAKRLAVQCVVVLRDLPLGEFSVLNNAKGSPFYANRDGTPCPIPLSISHREDRAFCAVSSQAGQLLGVDIERIEPRSDGFLTDYFTPKEQAYAEKLSSETRVVWVTAAWSLKESVLKALGIGLRVDTRQIEVHITGEGGGFANDSTQWLGAGVLTQLLDTQDLSAFWRREKDYVMTMVCNGGVEMERVCVDE